MAFVTIPKNDKKAGLNVAVKCSRHSRKLKCGLVNEQKESKKKSKAGYIIGSLALAAATFAAMPKVIDFIADKLDKPVYITVEDENDTEPVNETHNKPKEIPGDTAQEERDGEF